MVDKLDGELRQRLQQMTGSDALLPVIVTMKPGSRAADVLPARIEIEFPAISAASCKLTQIIDLSDHPSIQRIEFDGEVRALH
jgi:hypothetical protein